MFYKWDASCRPCDVELDRSREIRECKPQCQATLQAWSFRIASTPADAHCYAGAADGKAAGFKPTWARRESTEKGEPAEPTSLQQAREMLLGLAMGGDQAVRATKGFVALALQLQGNLCDTMTKL